MTKTATKRRAQRTVPIKHAWETMITVSGPDDVRRSVQIVGGVRSWGTPDHREIYQVGNARVEICAPGYGRKCWETWVSAATSAAVLDGVARLGFSTHDRVVRATVTDEREIPEGVPQ